MTRAATEFATQLVFCLASCPELRIPTAQLKREWSLWPEFGWIRGICATFQRDILRRRF
jgi:hypothetical protein